MKRRLIQLYSALLFNANLKGFGNGQIYKGQLKNICTPGLNCYSCPGASGACPLGSLQNALASSGKTVPFYILGIIMLYGLLFGRWICGFLCPFGLIQELLHKIKTPKLKKSRFTRALSYTKYIILAVFVFLIPIIYIFRKVPLPAFCKYICPAGTLEGALGLLQNEANHELLGMLGGLFTWKFILLVWIIALSIFVYRFFCRFLCPLGALYGLFNKISFIGVKLDRPKCIDCGKCINKCKMDIKHVGDAECISCGECISDCPTKAISWKGGKVALALDTAGSTEKDIKNKKMLRALLAIGMSLLLVTTLVYFNFIDKNEASVGYEVGEMCGSVDVQLVTGGLFSLEENRGKITVINFWGTWCKPCIEELPTLDRIASEYKDKVTVIAVHSEYKKEEAEAFALSNYPGSAMMFAYDTDDTYYNRLGGRSTYPMTVIINQDGIIIARYQGAITYENIVNEILK